MAANDVFHSQGWPLGHERLVPSITKQHTSGEHAFDRLCQSLGIEHRPTKPRAPQTNGMVERFNGRIAEVLATRRYDSAQDLETMLLRYVWLYNHHLPQKALGHRGPMDAMKQWYAERPGLFTKQPRNHPGPGTKQVPGYGAARWHHRQPSVDFARTHPAPREEAL